MVYSIDGLTPRPLRDSKHPLRASKQPLRASKHPLRASKQPLRASKQPLLKQVVGYQYHRLLRINDTARYIAVTIIILWSSHRSNDMVSKATSLRNTKDHLVWTAGNGDPMHEEVHLTQDASRIGTARVKKEEEANIRIIAEIWQKGMWAWKARVPNKV